MVGFAAIAVWLTVGGNKSLVQIALSAYTSIGMLAPGVFLAFLWPRTTAVGVGDGDGKPSWPPFTLADVASRVRRRQSDR